MAMATIKAIAMSMACLMSDDSLANGLADGLANGQLIARLIVI